jgi:tRNA (cmo5U34)-methyltransferase
MDNTTAHPASEYEREIARTIPLHAEILAQAVDVALAWRPSPSRWLDTGCGTGALARIARSRCAVDMTFADPSPDMLALARSGNADLAPERFLAVPSEELPALAPFDVVTAVLCHQYGDEVARARAVARCFARLAPGGVFVAFENVRAESDAGHTLQRRRWAAWQREQGRDEPNVQAHLAREGTKFFPIRASQHLRLLSDTGFELVELVWRSQGQAGFAARKRG